MRRLSVSDLRSQLIAKLGVEAPEDAPQTDAPEDALAPHAHLATEWFELLVPLADHYGIKLAAKPAFTAAQNAHHVALKKLKGDGRRRERKALSDAYSRYAKRREKRVWARLKSELNADGQSAKLYRSLKSGSVPAETLLHRWSRIRGQRLSVAELRAELLRG